jgi:hypothetical protein
VEALIWEEAKDISPEFRGAFILGFQKGYKAASKKWTNEDIINAVQFGIELHHSENPYNWSDKTGEYLKSLSPTLVPIGFEPELDWKDTLLPYRDLSIRQYRVVDGVLQGTYKFKE